MTLTQSVGVIMGANIGTTVTGQLIRMADISGDSLWLTLIPVSYTHLDVYKRQVKRRSNL